MKRLFCLAFLLAAASPTLAAGFTGPAAPAEFSVLSIGTLTGTGPLSPGFAVFGADQLVLVGGNTGNPSGGAPGCLGGDYAVLASPCQLQVTLAVPGTYSFDWSYVSADADGPPGDIFGVIVDGQRIALSNPGGAVAQTGTSSYSANSSFGWLLNCTDCTGGFATATVSGFALVPVPEPASVGMMLAGLATVAAVVRRRRATHC